MNALNKSESDKYYTEGARSLPKKQAGWSAQLLRCSTADKVPYGNLKALAAIATVIGSYEIGLSG